MQFPCSQWENRERGREMDEGIRKLGEVRYL